MPLQSAAATADFWTLMSVLIVSTVSGFISIATRIGRGAAVNTLWIVSEFAAALLGGYLMFDAFPHMQDWLPDFFTLPIAVAAAAHSGGRLLQAFEGTLYKRLSLPDRREAHLGEPIQHENQKK